MSRLRKFPTKHKCEQKLLLDENGKDRGICNEPAVIRCNACRQYFCEECWTDHWEMTIVSKGGQLCIKQHSN